MPKVAKHTPKSLQEALESGWRIDEELSTWEFDGSSKREGFLFLRKKGAGARRLTIRFTALYDTRRPYFMGDGA